MAAGSTVMHDGGKHDPMSLDQELLHPPGEWIQAALAGIGAATIVTDALGRVRFMNSVAEFMTGWSQGETRGQPLAVVFKIENEATRLSVTDPVADVLVAGTAIALSDHTVLIARNGTELRIDHGAAPVRDAAGAVVGAVVIFCDVSERQRAVQGVEDARAFAEGIVQTVREPLVVLDAELRVRIANRSFYQTFRVTPSETEGEFFFELGNRQWDIPRLRELLEEILPRDSHFDDFAVECEFEGLGFRSMVLNARCLPAGGRRPALILLAIEDATERRRAAEALALSETRYRRLFETAQDGILLVAPDTRLIFDANPFLTELLGYTRTELVGKELWEIGLFRDIESNKTAFRTLQEKGYIRYDDLPLRMRDDRGIDVEFVSNVYDVGATRVIQCNIRDVTDRKKAEHALRAAHAGLELRILERTAELADLNATLKEEIARREGAELEQRALQQQLTTVQEDERRRIARELHDQMGQHLTALGLGLKIVKNATPDPSPERDRLRRLLSITDTIGREVHHLALELRPTTLDDFGLQAALANYAEGWSERSGIEVDFHGSGPDEERLPPPVETALYRVIQEALTNILKHAAARRVSVVLQRSSGQISAVIEDDGRGFDADSVAEHRLGILGMRERVALVGGTLTVESGSRPGTTVIARIPLQPSDRRRPQ
ncbi:PAS domain-containing sensor histidine kinase [Fimbriiglobus ruber]|uniref:histidine kinase n=1 Tax=Fimbriiglobus ruber TaxID=1908690 RepID=A0A225DUK0_9BACT|nr:PAS domain S-box protein [Fimbriiglobus ruber]OWK39827.1 multi-sensor signal transduction histidine kinase [Fimbriiglobus ruber]